MLTETPWRRNLALLWFSQLLVMAGFAAMIPFIPLFIKDELGVVAEGELAFGISMFNFCGTLAYAIFIPLWGYLADRFGVKPMLLRGTFVTAFFFPMMGYVTNVGSLAALRFITAALAGTTAASQTMIARTAPNERQGFAQGVLTTAIWGGSVLGNVVGGFIIHWFNYRCAFWFCGILYFIAGFSILFTQDDFIRTVKTAVKPRRVPGTIPLLPSFTYAVWLLLGVSCLYGLIRSFEAPFISLKIEAVTSPETAAYWTGVVSAAACAGAIVSGFFAGWLSDILPPKRILTVLMILSAAALILQGWAESLWFFCTARVMLFLVIGGIHPLIQKLLSGSAPKRKRGKVFGFASCALQLGGIVSAALGGWTLYLLNLNGVFYVAGILFLLMLPLFLRVVNKVIHEPYYRKVNRT